MKRAHLDLGSDLGSWGTPRIGVVGDLILDRYTMGNVERVSPEAPVPVLHVSASEIRLGGAANVAANLTAGGFHAWMCGFTGDDQDGVRLRQLLDDHGCSDEGVIRHTSRPTVVKERIIARNQQMIRVDYEQLGPLEKEVEDALIEVIRSAPSDMGAWVLSDYGKGVLSRRVFEAVLERGEPTLVDPKGTDYSPYRGATLITPNRAEAEAATRMRLTGPDQWRAAAQKLIDDLSLEAATITLGSEGIYARLADGQEMHIQTEARTVYDVTGAGDTVISWMAAALASRRDVFQAVQVANVAAGIVVGRLGTATVTRKEVIGALESLPASSHSKIVPMNDIGAVLQTHRERGEVVVMTNGCFDILHDGHVDYLHFARSRGDLLVVGLNEDESISRLKGDERPINRLEARAKVLAALADVDYVVPFAEETPEKLIREVSPQVLVKGEDWRDKGVVGREWVESHGGVVVLAPLTHGRSTTSIIDRVKKSGA